MKRLNLKRLIFMALCCDLGIVAKRLIAPAANIITDALHVPGGIGTAFSLMFLVLAAAFVPCFGAGALMGAVQSAIALCLGTVSSLGPLMLPGYVLPGLAIDGVLLLCRGGRLNRNAAMVIANAVAAAVSSLTANVVVFRLRGAVLALYLGVSLAGGALFGVLAGQAAEKLEPVLGDGRIPGKQTADGADRGSGNMGRAGVR